MPRPAKIPADWRRWPGRRRRYFGVEPRGRGAVSTALGQAIDRPPPGPGRIAPQDRGYSRPGLQGAHCPGRGPQRIENFERVSTCPGRHHLERPARMGTAARRSSRHRCDGQGALHLKGPAPRIAPGEFARARAGRGSSSNFRRPRGRGSDRLRDDAQKIRERSSNSETSTADHRRHFEVTPGGQIRAEMAEAFEGVGQDWPSQANRRSSADRRWAMMFGEGDPESIGCWRSQRRGAENYVEHRRPAQPSKSGPACLGAVHQPDRRPPDPQNAEEHAGRGAAEPCNSQCHPRVGDMNPTLANRRHHQTIDEASSLPRTPYFVLCSTSWSSAMEALALRHGSPAHCFQPGATARGLSCCAIR